MKVINISPSQNLCKLQRPSFSGDNFKVESDSFQKQSASDIKIILPKSIFDVFKSNEKKLEQIAKVEDVRQSVQKVDKFLTEKGYEPCKEFIISHRLIDPYNTKKVGGRYIEKLGKIGLSQKTVDTKEEYEFLILHEQGHYLHHQKLKRLGMEFSPKPLTQEERQIVAQDYKKIFADKYNEQIEEVIQNTYLENSLEFVGYYFTFKNRGVEFSEATKKIYEKYYGP